MAGIGADLLDLSLDELLTTTRTVRTTAGPLGGLLQARWRRCAGAFPTVCGLDPSRWIAWGRARVAAPSMR